MQKQSKKPITINEGNCYKKLAFIWLSAFCTLFIMISGYYYKTICDNNINLKYPVVSAIGNIRFMDCPGCCCRENDIVQINYCFRYKKELYCGLFRGQKYNLNKPIDNYNFGSNITIFYRKDKPETNSIFKSDFKPTVSSEEMYQTIFSIVLSVIVSAVFASAYA